MQCVSPVAARQVEGRAAPVYSRRGMTETPDLASLARRYLDLWESQVAALAGDPAIAAQMTRLLRALGATMAAGSGRDGVDAHEGKRRGSGKAGTPTAGAASGDGGVELARLGRRLAALERRLERLEAAARKPRKNGARPRKRAR